jgi:hypothetical protein
MLHLLQKDQCGKRLASAEAMLSRSMKPVVRAAQPSSGQIKAMYEEAKTVGKKAEKLGGYDIDDIGQDFNRFVKQKLEDIDYDYGKDVVHGSSMAGVEKLTPQISAASMQGHYGLTPQDGAVFAYDPNRYGSGFKNILASSLMEHAGESTSAGSSSFSPTAYLGRAPLTGLMSNKEFSRNGWLVSTKPVRVKDSFPMKNHGDLTNWLESLDTKTVDEFVQETRGPVTESVA